MAGSMEKNKEMGWDAPYTCIPNSPIPL